MLKEIYGKLDIYRKQITPFVELSEIEKKEEELGIKFPDRMVEFYHYFGNDNTILSADYIFDKLEDIRIEDNALCIGYME